jgi:hypothetical protein
VTRDRPTSCGLSRAFLLADEDKQRSQARSLTRSRKAASLESCLDYQKQRRTGLTDHALNRANARLAIFPEREDYVAYEHVLAEVFGRLRLRAPFGVPDFFGLRCALHERPDSLRHARSERSAEARLNLTARPVALVIFSPGSERCPLDLRRRGRAALHGLLTFF